MACAHAKFTGEAGVCLATSGPGAIHLLNGLYDAKLDHQPVVAIVGQQAQARPGRQLSAGGRPHHALQGRRARVRPDGHRARPDPPPDRPRDADRALRAHRHLRDRPQRPADGTAVPTPPHAHGTVHSGPGYTPPRVTPNDEQLQRAAEVLNAGERVAMLVGAGALHATQEVIEVADTLGAGVAKALLGKAAVPDDLPFVTGSIGLLGTRPSWDMMQDCDTLLMVGSSFPYSEFLPEEGQAARRADRPRRPDARHPLPDGGQPRRRQRAHPRSAPAAARAQGRPRLAGEDRKEHERVVAGDRDARSRSRPSRSTRS